MLSCLTVQVVEFFYRGADAGSENLTPAATLAELYGDFLFFAPSVNWMRTLVAQPHDGNRYMYVFDHDFAFNRHYKVLICLPSPIPHWTDSTTYQLVYLLQHLIGLALCGHAHG